MSTNQYWHIKSTDDEYFAPNAICNDSRLGISKKFLYLELVHKPTVDLDGPAFLLVTFGNETTVEPKILDLNCPFVNPAGLPLIAGVENVVFLKFDISGPLANPSLLKYYKSLAAGDKLEIHIKAYKLLTTPVGASIQLLDTIHVVVIKPDYKLHDGMVDMPMIGPGGPGGLGGPGGPAGHSGPGGHGGPGHALFHQQVLRSLGQF
eukprot:gene10958-22891_t